MIEQRDLFLVPFPFSDQSGRKVRPVVVLSNDVFNQHSEDMIVVAVTSNVTKDRYSILLSPDELEEGILKHTCCIKVENILKIDKRLVIKKIGKIKPMIFQKAVEILNEIMR